MPRAIRVISVDSKNTWKSGVVVAQQIRPCICHTENKNNKKKIVQKHTIRSFTQMRWKCIMVIFFSRTIDWALHLNNAQDIQDYVAVQILAKRGHRTNTYPYFLFRRIWGLYILCVDPCNIQSLMEPHQKVNEFAIRHWDDCWCFFFKSFFSLFFRRYPEKSLGTDKILTRIYSVIVDQIFLLLTL